MQNTDEAPTMKESTLSEDNENRQGVIESTRNHRQIQPTSQTTTSEPSGLIGQLGAKRARSKAAPEPIPRAFKLAKLKTQSS